MVFTETPLADSYIIEPQLIEDARGHFGRIWCRNEFEKHGLNPDIVQSNLGFSKKRGTLRGLHFQKEPFQEAKLVRCCRGAIYDVIVDLRRDSPTHGKWFGIELSESNARMIYSPSGFAQGYLTLSDDTEIYYHTTQFYAPAAAFGIRFDDPAFAIDWPGEICVISEIDRSWPNYSL